MGKPTQQPRHAERMTRRQNMQRLYDQLGQYFQQVPGGIGDKFGGYTPGPGGLLEMEADQKRTNKQFLERLKRARLKQLAESTQAQVQQDLQQRLQGRMGGGGGSMGGIGGLGSSGGLGSFGGFDLGSIGGSQKRGVVTITDLEE